MNVIDQWKRKFAFSKIDSSPPVKRLSNSTEADLALLVSINSPREFLEFKEFYKLCSKRFARVKAVVYTNENYNLSTLNGMVAIKRSDCDFLGIPKKNSRIGSFLGTIFDLLIDLDQNHFPFSAWFAKNTQARLKFKRGEPDIDVYDVILTSHESWNDIMKEVERFTNTRNIEDD